MLRNLSPLRLGSFIVQKMRSVRGRARSGIPTRANGRHLVLLIHGLSGSALGTWAAMLKQLKGDPELADFALGAYSYPSALLRLPLGKRMPGIREIADGLRTHIKTNYGDKTGIVIVGHSLGGVIARQYVLDEVKCNRAANLRGVALFATPHTGAALARIGSSLSFSHRHLRQLCKGSDILEIINDDWVTQRTEQQIPTIYIVGGADAVVPRESAVPYAGAKNVRTLIEHGHLNIIEPVDRNDIRFKVLKQFITESMPNVPNETTVPQSPRTTAPQGDVLFDFYSPRSESFYLNRPIDDALADATTTAHAWVWGEPGVGKTVALRRLADRCGWRTHHIVLDSYAGLGAIQLMREVCNLLCERADIELAGIPRDVDSSTLIRYFQRALIKLNDPTPLSILIEEIPLGPGAEYTRFLDIAHHLAIATETIAVQSRIIWLFSSLRNPRPDVRAGSTKLFERVQFLQFEPWKKDDLLALVNMICDELNIAFTSEERGLIVERAEGSPRFVKMLFRRRRNEVGSKKSLRDLLSCVECDIT